MPPFQDLSAQRFGSLVVLRRAPNTSYGRTAWTCRCDCGKEKDIVSVSLIIGHSKSCGCLYIATRQNPLTHGKTVGGKIPAEYRVWHKMLERCRNPSNKDYKDYGGRGIAVCERWQKFENFLEDMGNRPSEKHSLDREKNHLGYSKENCRWATQTQQTRNARSNVIVSVDGRKVCLSEAAEIYGVEYHKFRYRVLEKGMSVEDAARALGWQT